MRRHVFSFVAALALVGCAGQITSDDDGSGGDDDDPAACVATRSYIGFGGDALEASRPQLAAGADRMRLKPFGALATEYQRALALTTFDTRAYAATFGRPPARWFLEPAASANTVYAAFALAFDACTQHTGVDARYAEAPSLANADPICRDLALRAWHRDAADDEAAACVTYAVDQTNPADDPRRRWAYACAAVLGASGFLAY
ncbi:MAG TPA: hypothetical protein VFQ53_31475 [Kofleriaceae bacterium]|nr:hypothetical protein [Kofleriaceae bacterium]